MRKYVVQRAVEIGEAEPLGDASGAYVGRVDPSERAGVLWEDVCTLDVPPKLHAKTVVERALAELDVKDEDLPQHFRAIPADRAEPVPVRVEKPPAPAARRIVG